MLAHAIDTDQGHRCRFCVPPYLKSRPFKTNRKKCPLPASVWDKGHYLPSRGKALIRQVENRCHLHVSLDQQETHFPFRKCFVMIPSLSAFVSILSFVLPPVEGCLMQIAF